MPSLPQTLNQQMPSREMPNREMPSQELMGKLQPTHSQQPMLPQWTVPSLQLMVQMMLLQPPTKLAKRRKILRRRRLMTELLLLMVPRLPPPKSRKRRKSSMAPSPITKHLCRRPLMVMMTMRMRRGQTMQKTPKRLDARLT